MANGETVDPYRNFNFPVEIDGITQAGFAECTGLRRRATTRSSTARATDRTTVRKLPGLDEVQQHHAQVGPDGLARALRLVPRHHQGQDRAQERQHRPDRPRRATRRSAGTSSSLAHQVGRPGLQRRGHRRGDRDARARPRAGREGVAMIQTEHEFTLPLGYLDEDGTLHRDGVMRLATAADEILPLRDARVQAQRGVPDRDPAVAGDHAARDR